MLPSLQQTEEAICQLCASLVLIDLYMAGLSGIYDPSTWEGQMALAEMNVLSQKPKHYV